MRTSLLTVSEHKVHTKALNSRDPSPQNSPLFITPVLIKRGTPKNVLMPHQLGCSNCPPSPVAAGRCTSKALKMVSIQDSISMNLF